MTRTLTVLLLCLALGLPARAALPVRGGTAVPTKAVRTDALATVALALPDRASLAAEDAARAADGAPYRFALPAEVALEPGRDGTWEDLGDGRALWRLRVSAPGALSLNLGFTTYDLPPGGRLAVYPADAPGAGWVFDADDNAPHGQLWTPVLLTDDLVVELVVDAAERARVGLVLGTVGRGYRLFGGEPRDKAGACNVNVVCPEGDPWRGEIAAVGVYTLLGSFKCTGAMINNTARDRRPFFLTAEHCEVGAATAASVVVYWNYEAPVCGVQGGGALDDVQAGSSLRAVWVPSDMTLLELDDLPPSAYGVTYAGWNRTDTAPGSAVAIHHPNTEEKCISFENDPLTVTGYDSATPNPSGDHLRVADWDLGTTEVGSSGSPLFGPDHRVVGQLHGGYAACGNNLSDWYGRFAVSWTGGGTPATSLAPWLDPAGTGETTTNLLDPDQASFSVLPDGDLYFGGQPGGPFLTVDEPPAAQVVLTLSSVSNEAAAWSAPSPATWLAVTPDAGTLASGASTDVVVAPSATAPDLAPGRHTARLAFVNVTSGRTERTLTVTLDVYGPGPRLMNVYPNPSWGPLTLEYTLGRAAPVRVRFYDVRGRVVADLGTHAGGEGLNSFDVPWWGGDGAGLRLPGGVYFVELEALGQRDRARLARTH